MPFWLKMMSLILGYIGIWIIVAWAMVRYFDAETDDAVYYSFLWPLFLPFLLLCVPFVVIAFIVEKMTGEK